MRAPPSLVANNYLTDQASEVSVSHSRDSDESSRSRGRGVSSLMSQTSSTGSSRGEIRSQALRSRALHRSPSVNSSHSGWSDWSTATSIIGKDNHTVSRALYGALLVIIEQSKLSNKYLYFLQVKIFPFLWLLIDFIQLSSTPLMGVLPPPDSKSWASGITQMLQPLVSQDEPVIRSMFWPAFAWVSVALLGLAVFYVLLNEEKTPPPFVSSSFGAFLAFTVSFGYIPTLRILLHIPPSRFQDTVWAVQLSMGIILSAFFLCLSLFVSINYFEVDKYAGHLLRRSDGLFDFVLVIVRTIITVAMVFTKNPVALALVQVFAIGALYTYLLLINPYHVRWVGNLRRGLLLSSIFIAICWMFVTVNEADGKIHITTREIVTGIILGGVLPLTTLGFLLQREETPQMHKFYRVLYRLLWQFIIDFSPPATHRLGLERMLRSATRLGQYAKYMELLEYDTQAQKLYMRALAAEPLHPTNNGAYAHFQFTRMDNPLDAKRFFDIAFKQDPNHSVNLGYYAHFLLYTEDEVENAEMFYKRHVETDPNSTPFRGMYTSISEGLAFIDTIGNLVDVNAAVLRLFKGTTREMFCQHRLFDLAPLRQSTGKKSKSLGLQYIQSVVKTRQESRFQWKFLRFDDTTFDCEVVISPLESNDKLLQVSITDIQNLGYTADFNVYLEVLLSSVPDGILLLNERGVIEKINHPGAQMFGYMMGIELVGTDFVWLFEPPHKRKVQRLSNSVSGSFSSLPGTANSFTPGNNNSSSSESGSGSGSGKLSDGQESASSESSTQRATEFEIMCEKEGDTFETLAYDKKGEGFLVQVSLSEIRLDFSLAKRQHLVVLHDLRPIQSMGNLLVQRELCWSQLCNGIRTDPVVVLDDSLKMLDLSVEFAQMILNNMVEGYQSTSPLYHVLMQCDTAESARLALVGRNLLSLLGPNGSNNSNKNVTSIEFLRQVVTQSAFGAIIDVDCMVNAHKYKLDLNRTDVSDSIATGIIIQKLASSESRFNTEVDKARQNAMKKWVIVATLSLSAQNQTKSPFAANWKEAKIIVSSLSSEK